MVEAPEKAYCISCGEEVPVKIGGAGIDGEGLLQCAHCGSFLGTTNSPQTLAAPARPPRSGLPAIEHPGEFHSDESLGEATGMPELSSAFSIPTDAGGDLFDGFVAELPEEEPGGPPLQSVMTVEDSTLISSILNDMLVQGGLTRRVIHSKNGYEFLARYIRERQAVTNLGLVVMDVKMPILNGIISAVAMRAHEKAQGFDPVPILFFTSKRCDETFRKVLLHCAPAMYINKGTSESPEDLQDRISKIIRQLLREEW